VAIAKIPERPILSRSIQDLIRNYILGRNLRPGDPLPPQGKLASDLGVSRNSVREAVRALESLGILEVRHGTGLFVRSANLDAVLDVLSYNLAFEPLSLLDLLRIRRLLESSIISEVAQRIQQEDLEACRGILKEWESNVNAGLSFTEQERLFHETLYRGIGNQLIVDLIDVFWVAYRNAEARMDLASRSPRDVFEHHRMILQAVEGKNYDLAKRLMFDHFQEGEERLESTLRNRLDARKNS
jgi:DNA-binding FadR family transcriptional regulator